MSADPGHDGRETQLRLALHRPPSFDRGDFLVSACNREAARLVDTWPDWPGGRLAVFGPEGVGKSHLARSWAESAGAFVVGDSPVDFARLGHGPVLLEDADRRADETTLFHLINRADSGDSLLLTGRTPPRQWPAGLPDLRSRLNALMAVEIEPPDDAVLRGVLVKLFRERNIRPDQELLGYLLRRIERSVPAAARVVSRIDDVADASRREITRALAREILESGDKTLNLFD